MHDRQLVSCGNQMHNRRLIALWFLMGCCFNYLTTQRALGMKSNYYIICRFSNGTTTPNESTEPNEETADNPNPMHVEPLPGNDTMKTFKLYITRS